MINPSETVQQKLKAVKQFLYFGFGSTAVVLFLIGMFIFFVTGASPLVIGWLLALFVLLVVAAAINAVGLYWIASLYLQYKQRREQEEVMFP